MAIGWGTRILLLYLGFVTLIGVLVWKSTHTPVNLVAEDYYQQELVFQKKLDAAHASSLLAKKPVVFATEDAIRISFPTDYSGQLIEATLQLYYTPDARLDQRFEKLQTRDAGLSIPRKDLQPLKYTAQLSWSCKGTTYYQESPLNLKMP